MNLPDVKSGDLLLDEMTAETDRRIFDYCRANPKARLMEAAEQASEE